MSLLLRTRALLRSLFHRDEVETELNDEVQAFYDTVVDRLVEQGTPRQEAIRQANIKFHLPEQAKNDIREALTGEAIASVGREVRYALRTIKKSPAFAVVTVLTLGFGIAANATIFSMVSRFVLHAPPVGHPSTLMALHTTDRGECCNSFSYPLFNSLREQVRSFSGVASYYELVPASMGGSGEPERVWGQAATANFFDVIELGMSLGRGFARDEEHAQVVVLGQQLWQHRFGGDPGIIGRVVNLSGRPFRVVGVAPPGFRGVDIILDCQFWVPLAQIDQLLPGTSNYNSRDYHWVTAVGRLKPDVTRAEAAAELHLLAQRFAKAYPEPDKNLGFQFEPAGSLPPSDKSAVLMFLGALTLVALLVLAIACANVTNMFLSQASGRQREMAVRLALGATRPQLLRLILTESVILAMFGGAFGVTLSFWATRALSSFRFPAPVPLDLTLHEDWRVLLFSFGLSAIAGVLFGLSPAWLVVGPVIASGLKGEDVVARPGNRWTLRNILVVSQIAMSVVLLCATGLFLRSFENAAHVNIGFRSRGIVMMAVDPRLHGYTADRTAQFLDEVRRRVATLPGVVSATYTDDVPLSGGHRSDGFQVVGSAASSGVPVAELYMAGPDYFDTLGISLLSGRTFTNETANSPKVAIVNQAFAASILQGKSPIGQIVTGGGRTYRIIGVVSNIKSRTLGEDTRPVLFRSLVQDIPIDPSTTGYFVMVRYSRDPGAVIAAVRREIHSLDPTLAIFNVATMEEHLRDALFLPRLTRALFGVFGVLGLLLAAVGLYGVMSYWVSRRTREIGIRLALGARVGDMQWMIIRQGMTLTLIALLPGLAAAWAISKLFTSILYGVAPHDLATFALVPLFLAIVSFLACWIPSLSAAGAEPLTALRHE